MRRYYPIPPLILAALFLFFFIPHTHAAVIGVPPKVIPNTGLSNGLVGYWTFDGKDVPNGRANDISGNGNHGDLVNIATSTFYVRGKMGQGFNFDGSNDYVNAGSASSLDDIESQSTGMTISLWMKVAGASTVISKNTSASGAWRIDLQGSGRIYFEKDGGADDLGARASANSYELNKWQHLVLVWDGSLTASNILFYVDKSLKSHDLNDNSVGVWSDASSNLRIGTGVNGILDDVRVYNRALSASEIQQLYNIGTATKRGTSPKVTSTSCTTGLSCGLVGYWTFDGKDMPGGRANDVSGSGYTGTLINISTSTFYTRGKTGQGIQLNGVSGRVVTNFNTQTVFGATGSHSISFWVYPTSQNSARWYSATDSGASRMYLGPSGTNNQLFLGLGSWNPFISSGFVLNQWQHYVVVLDGTNGYVYRNGSVLSSTSGITVSNPNQAFVIGSQVAGNVITYGKLDDFRLYNRALSATEIQQLYSVGAATKQGTSPKVTSTSCTTGLSCGLVGYWTFDGKDVPNGRANDLSGNGNHGNLINIATSTFYVRGKMGQGFKFDEDNDYINIPYNASFDASALTVSAWVFITSTTRQDFVVKDHSTSGFAFNLNSGSTAGTFGFRISNTAATISNSTYLDKWVHLVGVYDGTSKIYVNGVLQNTSGSVSIDHSGSFAVNIGGYGTTNTVGGKIDDVRIYNRALSASEIQQLYNVGR